MHTTKVSYSKVFPLGGYSNEKIGVEIDVQPGDDVQKAIQEARQFVEFNHKVNGIVSEIAQCETIINDPDNYTGAQVKRAKDRLDALHEQLNQGKLLLTQKQ